MFQSFLGDDDYVPTLTESALSGLASTRSAASALLGAPFTLATGPARTPGMNCGRTIHTSILSTGLDSIKPVSEKIGFAIPTGPSLVHSKPSHPVLAVHEAGSAFITQNAFSMAHEPCGADLQQAWKSPCLLP
jgi:hypothetical protein